MGLESRIDQIKERFKTEWYGACYEQKDFDTDIAYLLRIAEAAEVMREALEFYKLQGFFNSYDDKHKIHDYGERSFKALAKAKELMGE